MGFYCCSFESYLFLYEHPVLLQHPNNATNTVNYTFRAVMDAMTKSCGNSEDNSGLLQLDYFLHLYNITVRQLYITRK